MVKSVTVEKGNGKGAISFLLGYRRATRLNYTMGKHVTSLEEKGSESLI